MPKNSYKVGLSFWVGVGERNWCLDFCLEENKIFV